jgi:uncharacterized membrane protein
MPIVRRAYGVMAAAWLAMLPLATYAATRVHASTLTHAFAFAVYGIGSLVCHQKPERSFHLWAAQLPVCARCTGIYLGAVFGLARRPVEREASAERRGRARWLVMLAAIPTIATLVFEWTSGVMPSNAIRFAAGVPLGMVVSWLVLFRPAQVN